MHAQASTGELFVPINRSVLVTLKDDAEEVQVANPEIADIHAHNPKNVTIIGKQIGQTTVRIFSASGILLRDIGVTVGYDLPAIRKALKEFLPNEAIAVERVGSRIALTGQVSDAGAVDKAMKIVQSFMDDSSSSSAGSLGAPLAATGGGTTSSDSSSQVMNMLQVISGQQVMLRVQIGEIRREALKILGVNLNSIGRAAGEGFVGLGTGAGLAGLAANTAGTLTSPGLFTFAGNPPSNTQGILIGRWQPDGPSGNTIAGALRALERDGVFKLLAEPNLVAVSGEEAEFLAGGEIPIPVVDSSGSGTGSVSIEYKPFGVALRFTPQVLGENRVRMVVLPEVSEISSENAITISGFSIPSISTRRAKTTVELAPGEGFMIAGLIKDDMRATIDQLPGVKEVPVLGALFRSTEFRRNETELVIAVTPYIVDPLKSSDIKLPVDDFRASSQMEMLFYGALGSLSGNAPVISQTPPVEGPIGFMVD
ncbi:MAG: type II and III secretion system protein family protein [Alphaproteobacteria bacterium]